MICENLSHLKKNLGDDVILVAVSKTHPAEIIQEAYNCGHKDFGENKVQEMLSKQPLLPKDIKWHLIGHLQKNKVKFIAPFAHLIHSVDSVELLNVINKEGEKNNRKIFCLLQVKIATEESKFGMTEDEAEDVLKIQSTFPFAVISGLMGMATLTEDESQIRNEYRRLQNFFKKLQPGYPDLKILSMGMSGDYKIAVEEGSNMVRIGTAVFGQRR